MKDIIGFFIAFVLGYLFFMGIVIFIAKIVFPFLTKEELDRRDAISSEK